MPHCWRALGPRRSRAIRGFNLDTARFPPASTVLLGTRAEVLRGECGILGPALDPILCRRFAGPGHPGVGVGPSTRLRAKSPSFPSLVDSDEGPHRDIREIGRAHV